MPKSKLPPVEVCVVCRKPIRIPYEECIPIRYEAGFPRPTNPRLPPHLRYLAHPECYETSSVKPFFEYE